MFHKNRRYVRMVATLLFLVALTSKCEVACAQLVAASAKSPDLAYQVIDFPNGEALQGMLGPPLIQKFEVESRIRALEAIRRQNPDDSNVVGLLGQAYLESGNSDEAIRLWSTLTQKSNRRADVPSFNAELNLGLALGQAGRFREACSHLEAALRDPSTRQLRGEISRSLALAYIGTQQMPKAFDAALHALAAQPLDSNVWQLLETLAEDDDIISSMSEDTARLAKTLGPVVKLGRPFDWEASDFESSANTYAAVAKELTSQGWNEAAASYGQAIALMGIRLGSEQVKDRQAKRALEILNYSQRFFDFGKLANQWHGYLLNYYSAALAGSGALVNAVQLVERSTDVPPSVRFKECAVILSFAFGSISWDMETEERLDDEAADFLDNPTEAEAIFHKEPVGKFRYGMTNPEEDHTVLDTWLVTPWARETLIKYIDERIKNGSFELPVKILVAEMFGWYFTPGFFHAPRDFVQLAVMNDKRMATLYESLSKASDVRASTLEAFAAAVRLGPLLRGLREQIEKDRTYSVGVK